MCLIEQQLAELSTGYCRLARGDASPDGFRDMVLMLPSASHSVSMLLRLLTLYAIGMGVDCLSICFDVVLLRTKRP